MLNTTKEERHENHRKLMVGRLLEIADAELNKRWCPQPYPTDTRSWGRLQALNLVEEVFLYKEAERAKFLADADKLENQASLQWVAHKLVEAARNVLSAKNLRQKADMKTWILSVAGRKVLQGEKVVVDLSEYTLFKTEGKSA